MWSQQVRRLLHGQSPQLVLVDLDGTLIHSIPDLSAALDRMLMALGRSAVGVEAASHWVGNGVDMLVRRALASGDEAVALALSEQEIQQARVHFDAAYLSQLTTATGAYAGVEEWLASCPTNKVLITNKSRRFTEPLLAALNWQAHFVQVICGDDAIEKKPSPQPLLWACQQQSVSPEQALMVGDSRHDIAAAKAAKIACVAVSYGYNHGEPIASAAPDLIVDNLLELLAD